MNMSYELCIIDKNMQLTSAELINYDQRILRSSLHAISDFREEQIMTDPKNGRSLEHLSHESRNTLQLTISSSNSA